MILKNKLNNILIVLTIIFAIGTYFAFDYFMECNEKTLYRDVSGIVFDKLGEQKSHYKSTRVYTDFILVIKDKDTGKYFDVKVTPTTYSTHNIGDDIHFKKLSKSIIGEEYDGNGGIFIITIILAILSILCFSMLLTRV